MDPGKLFSIGDVARMFHISPGSLRHYEAIGLLTPEYVDPDTGYRYYSTRQFEPLNTIRYLRALDMPLPRIAGFLHDRDLDGIAEMLRQQQRAVAEKQAELERIARRLERRLCQLEDAAASELDVLRLTELPACRLCWLPEPLVIHDYYDMELPISRLTEAQPEAVIFLGKIGVGIQPERLLAGEFTRYDGVFLLFDTEEHPRGEVLELPAAPGVTVRFRGSHPQAPAQYRRLMAFLAEQRLVPAGFSREITLIDYGVTDDAAQFVTEISIPVRPAAREEAAQS